MPTKKYFLFQGAILAQTSLRLEVLGSPYALKIAAFFSRDFMQFFF
jgi:hypothetical protein